MKKLLKLIVFSFLLLMLAATAYAGIAYFEAVADSGTLRDRADKLIAQNLGGNSLGQDRLKQMLLVQDPAFESHRGIDLTTPGAGITTISQSVSKRLAFDNFKPGIGKIRQTGYALGLESKLSKAQILALWLETLEMGRGPGGWMTGFHHASETIYDLPPDALNDEQYFGLLAVLIAPSKYNLGTDDAELAERVRRISRLVANECTPDGNADVWLEACR